MGKYQAGAGVDFDTALNEARGVYGGNLNQGFLFKGQEYNAGTGMPMDWSMSAGNNKMPNNQNKIKSQGITKSQGTNQGFTGQATSFGTQGGSSVTSKQVTALQDKPTDPILRQKLETKDTIQLEGGWKGEADNTSMQVQSGNVRIGDYGKGEVTDLGGVAPLAEPVNVAQRVSDEDISSMLAGKEVIEGSLSTGALLSDKGAISDKDLLNTIGPLPELDLRRGAGKIGEKIGGQVGASKSLPASTLDRGLSFTPDLTSSGKGLMDVSGGTTGGLTAEGLTGEAAGGGLGDMLGKAGGMMSKAAPGIMAGISILGEAGAMSA